MHGIMEAVQKGKMATVANLRIEQIRIAWRAAQEAMLGAVEKAVALGQLLRETKEEIGHGEFMEWLGTNVPEIPGRTARRWMAVAERVFGAVRLPAIEVGSQLLLAPPAELDEQAQEARQLLLGFMDGKTLKELMGGWENGKGEDDEAARGDARPTKMGVAELAEGKRRRANELIGAAIGAVGVVDSRVLADSDKPPREELLRMTVELNRRLRKSLGM